MLTDVGLVAVKNKCGANYSAYAKYVSYTLVAHVMKMFLLVDCTKFR